MSLGVAIQVFHSLLDGTPLDLEQNPHKQKKPLMPTVHKIRDSFGRITEEDYKWLIR